MGIITLALTTLGGATGCTSTGRSDDPAIADYRQRIISATKPYGEPSNSGHHCAPVPGTKLPPDNHKFASVETFFPDHSGDYPSYAEVLSHSPKSYSDVSRINCWDAMYEFLDIGDLKDRSKSWVRLISAVGYSMKTQYAHKCLYSETPHNFTTDVCPELDVGKQQAIRELNAKLVADRAKTIETTKPRTLQDVCPPNPADEKGPNTYGDFNDYVPSKDGSFVKRVKAFAKANSLSPRQSTSITTATCWDGGQYEVAIIGDLKNQNMSWIKIISASNGNQGGRYAHTCIYAETPSFLTTNACPSLPSSELN